MSHFQIIKLVESNYIWQEIIVDWKCTLSTDTDSLHLPNLLLFYRMVQVWFIALGAGPLNNLLYDNVWVFNQPPKLTQLYRFSMYIDSNRWARLLYREESACFMTQ